MSVMMRQALLAGFGLASVLAVGGVSPVAAAGPVPYMVRNINPGGASSYPYGLTAIGNLLYFSANDGTHGYEIWRSDGTKAGTYQVADIAPSSPSSNPFGYTAVGPSVFFSANDGTSGSELWVTNGTSAGTHLVADIRAGKKGSVPEDLTTLGSFVYFTANDGINGRELWRSNGTTTELVADVQPGSRGSAPENLTAFNGRLYFSALNRLWSTDGTSSGTLRVKDSKGGNVRAPDDLNVNAGMLYFAARTTDGLPATHLWRTDGSAAATYPISAAISPYDITNVGGSVYFLTWVGDGVGQLWGSDGTKLGTHLVTNVGSAGELTAVGSHMYFTSLGSDGMQSLMVSDGSASGTNSWRAANTNNGAYLTELTEFEGEIFYSANGYLMYDTCPVDCSQYSWSHLVNVDYKTSSWDDTELTVVGDTIFYAARFWDGSKGYELWAYTP